MDRLRELVKAGEGEGTVARVEELLKAGKSPEAMMKEAMIPAMDEVGDLFRKGDYFMPEMLIAARAMQQGMNVLKPHMVKSGIKPTGKVLVGTVKGDLHDIGKNLLTMALEGAGFEVVDLGTDVAPAGFIEAIKQHRP